MKAQIPLIHSWNWTWFGEAVLLAFVGLVFILEIPIATRDPNAGKLDGEVAWTVDVSKESHAALDAPFGLTVDSSGKIYVADRGTKKVQAFSPEGALAEAWTGDSAGLHPFVEPGGLALDRGGKAVWILDAGNGWMYRLDEGGAVQALIDGAKLGLYHPRGLVVGPSGDLFVADTGNGRILHLDASGSLIQKWGSHGSKSNQLSDPTGLVVDGDSLYVVDVNNSRVVSFTLNGDLAGSWPIDSESTWIAADGRGRLFVSNHHNASVSVFNREGKALGKMAADDPLPPVDSPAGIAANPDGRLWMVGPSELAMYRLRWK